MPPGAPDRPAKTPVAAILSVLGIVAYPVLVYVGLTRWDVRAVGLGLTLVALVAVVRRVGVHRGQSLWVALPPLVPAAALGLGASATGDPRLLLGLPVLINLGLLAGFAATLRPGRTPMIERFARLVDPELPPGGEAYCRRVTIAWVSFFATNALLTGALALWAPLSWWTLYTGLLAYLAMGLMFTVEFIVRKAKFRRYGEGLLDRLCCRIFPPHEDAA